ncbi:SDR family NAD(P)-dependent oxidoreductase [Nocardioides cynanchi]|uniref:SDR family NAD(P)-dependent oxidoreductase n=1 Tax=Nocardioides cynanchi TaxID=2558918 RepID=UPI001248A41D|nr:SDR family NAD(P)-dependent oxidoreductase [Nocardioides cynanchi]
MGSIAGVVDQVLDRTVAPGYSRIGYHLRRRQWSPLPDGALDGRVVLVTGGTSGLGLATVEACARLGATVHLLGRDRQRGESAARGVRRRVPNAEIVVEECDLGSLPAVAAFAQDFGARVPALHGLVHNAGLMADPRTETPEGHELTLSVHVLGPHLLTSLLVPVLVPGSRVLFVSSGGMYSQPLAVDDPEFREGEYSGVTAYARAKRMQVVLAEQWAERLADRDITVRAMHPGWADTPGVQRHLPRFRSLTRPILRTSEEGADTIVWLLAADHLEPPTGGFWHDRAVRPTHAFGRHQESAADRARFWTFCDDAVAAYVGEPA